MDGDASGDLQAKGGRLPDGKSMKGAKQRLTLDKIQKYYPNAICTNVDPDANEQEDIKAAS